MERMGKRRSDKVSMGNLDMCKWYCTIVDSALGKLIVREALLVRTPRRNISGLRRSRLLGDGRSSNNIGSSFFTTSCQTHRKSHHSFVRFHQVVSIGIPVIEKDQRCKTRDCTA